jgi:hypothetical protein
MMNRSLERNATNPPPQQPRQNCPAGATFSERGLRKSIATFRRKIRLLCELTTDGRWQKRRKCPVGTLPGSEIVDRTKISGFAGGQHCPNVVKVVSDHS